MLPAAISLFVFCTWAAYKGCVYSTTHIQRCHVINGISLVEEREWKVFSFEIQGLHRFLDNISNFSIGRDSET